MLEVVRASSLDALIDETLPEPNRLTAPLDLPPGETEADYLERLRGAGGQQPADAFLHRPRLLRLRHAERDPA